MRAGDLCVLGGRTVFKVGYVVGPSRKTGKTRVRSFSASARSFSEIFVVPDELLNKLPPLDR